MTQEFYDKVRQSYKMLSLTNHQMRLLRFLEDNPESQHTVTELYIKFRLDYSQINNDLISLFKKGFLHRERIGKNSFYSVNLEFVTKLNNSLKVLNG